MSEDTSRGSAASTPPDSAQAAADRPHFRRYVWQQAWFQTMVGVLVLFLVLSYVVPSVLNVLYAVRTVLLPVLLGLGLAYIVNPVLTFAGRRLKIGRLAGTISIMLLALVVVAVTLVTAVPLLISQTTSLIETIQKEYPKYVDKILAEIDQNVPQDAKTDESIDVARETLDQVGQAIGADPVPNADGQMSDVDQQPEPAHAETDPDEAPSPGADAQASDQSNAEQPADPTKDEDVKDDDKEPRESFVARAAESFESPFMEKLLPPERNRRLLKMSKERLAAFDFETVSNFAMQSLDVGVGLVGSAISFTSYLLLSGVVIAFCFFFFSWKLDEIQAWFVPFIPKQHRERTLDVLKKMDMATSSFVRGRVIQSLVMMVALTIGWWIVGVPYWFLLGVLTGLMNLVPFLPAAGWIIALLLTVFTALSGDQGFTFGLVLWPSVVYFIAQGLDGWVVEPVVQGKATNLDPLTVLLVVLVGGSLAGLLGMLLAIPLAACVKIIAKEVVLPRLRSLAAEH